jgi:uncharacterized protein
MAEGGGIAITVLYSPAPREVHEWELVLPPGATVLQALEASGVREVLAGADLASAYVGVWGRKARLDHVLRERDRVEIYRPLLVDPKLARRERFRKQGVRAAGLFARKKAEGGPKV